MGLTLDRDGAFRHGLEESGLGPRRRPVQLVREDQLSEDRTRHELEALLREARAVGRAVELRGGITGAVMSRASCRRSSERAGTPARRACMAREAWSCRSRGRPPGGGGPAPAGRRGRGGWSSPDPRGRSGERPSCQGPDGLRGGGVGPALVASMRSRLPAPARLVSFRLDPMAPSSGGAQGAHRSRISPEDAPRDGAARSR